MVLTLIFSKKAQKVLKTSLQLSRQNIGKEQFGTSYVARQIVKQSILGLQFLEKIIPAGMWRAIGKRFESVKQSQADHSFDFIRASVVLICSSILISIATAKKLPLSTTYVTFMVAMGAAFADRSWGRESAVYRVNGVISVIFGWFLTALGASIFAFLVATFLYHGKMPAVGVAILVTLYVMLSPLWKKNVASEPTPDFVEDFEDFQKFSK